jgi:hypothetical protein
MRKNTNTGELILIPLTPHMLAALAERAATFAILTGKPITVSRYAEHLIRQAVKRLPLQRGGFPF